MALVPVAKGENLPFESACQAFEELCKPTNDRHHRENVVRRLWSNFGIEEHASFPLMRLIPKESLMSFQSAIHVAMQGNARYIL